MVGPKKLGGRILYNPYHPWDWYIYLHEWLTLNGKCREIYHTWMIWVILPVLNLFNLLPSSDNEAQNTKKHTHTQRRQNTQQTTLKLTVNKNHDMRTHMKQTYSKIPKYINILFVLLIFIKTPHRCINNTVFIAIINK